MQVSDPNNVKIYNLSAGKSLPEWLTEKKKREQLRKNVDIRRRIELIQGFDMPSLSNTIKVSPDGQYIYVTGIYKPRVKCFEVNNLSMKFERCLDAEVETFEILSDDYKKIAFLHSNRYVEFHAAHGRYYRLRVPRFGRDMKYNPQTCDLYVVAAGPDVYRLNLERGQFLNSFTTEASDVYRCTVNPVHNLFVCGTKEGKVEAWDPRTKGRVGTLDCAISCAADTQLEEFPSVTALKFQSGLTLGVGTATGHVLLYDIRSNKPYYIKDHMYGLPIKDIDFLSALGQDLVLSMDKSVVKIWDKNNGKLFTSVEALNTEFNSLCLVPNTGMFFLANEGRKIQTHYIPGMGPAPKWCAFLDNLTEELEESNMETMYDDYKFVTKMELEELGLDHLLGTNFLRAYMHGYFVDIHLYKKSKAVSEPFEFEEFRKKKIREKIDEGSTNRVVRRVLPKINKELALRMIDEEAKPHKKKGFENLLKDDRFKALFEHPDFEIDKTTDEYRLVNPAVSRLGKSREREVARRIASLQFDEVNDGKGSSDDSSVADDDSSTDDDREWKEEVQKQHRLIRIENQFRENQERVDREDRAREDREANARVKNQPKFYEIKEGEDFKGINSGLKRKHANASLGSRVALECKDDVRYLGSVGSRELSFSTVKEKARDKKAEYEAKKHKEERRSVQRPARSLHEKPKAKFYMGKRV